MLEIAAWATKEVGGKSVVGDARDQFHKLLMDARVMTKHIRGWRIAWQGKLQGSLPSDTADPVTLYSLKGGEETEWERQYLLDEFKTVHSQRQVTVKCFVHLQEFIDYLERLCVVAKASPRVSDSSGCV